MPSPLADAAWRAGLRVTYTLLRVYWFTFRPTIHSVQVAVWSGGRVLVVRQSYRRGVGLPAGGVHRRERPERAAARELREEVGLDVSPEQLRLVVEQVLNFEHKRDHTRIYRIDLEPEPPLTIDRREIVWADFLSPAEVRRLELFPWVRAYLDAEDRRRGG
jgi:8-oxo-dGTP pyrophosphatase MutT (NUDIX family)